MVDIDLTFKRAVWDMVISGHDISLCVQCGKCNEVCPISQRWGSRYNPRDLVLFSALGYKDALFAAVKRDPFVLWGCTTCETCDEHCPEHVPITEIICLLKNAASAAGAAPSYFPTSSKTIMENGMAIPTQNAIVKRRERLGVGPAPKIPADEVKKICEKMGLGEILKQ